MRKNAEKVLKAFEKGEPCHEKTISTNGQSLYSYNMLIAYHEQNEEKTIALVAYDRAPTATTRSHVRAAETHLRGRITTRF